MHLTGIKIKYSLRMFLEVLIFMILDVHARLHAQDFHQKILKKKKKKKQKATQYTLIFQVIGPAHKIKLIVYMHLIIHQRLFAFRPSPEKRNTFLFPNIIKLTMKNNSWEVWWCAWTRMPLFALGFGTPIRCVCSRWMFDVKQRQKVCCMFCGIFLIWTMMLLSFWTTAMVIKSISDLKGFW